MTTYRFLHMLLVAGLTGGLSGPSSLWAMPNAQEAPASIPLLVPLTRISQVTTGTHHTCALTTAGSVKCWGNNTSGEIGDNTQGTERLTPVDVSGLSDGIKAIAAGKYHTCALLAGGAKCWGNNIYGQIGDNTENTDRLTPVDVSGLSSGVSTIDANGDNTCALTSSGAVRCWGENTFGQVGDGTHGTDHLTPVDVVGLDGGVAAIAVGGSRNCAVTIGGDVKCWGRNSGGQVGDGTIETVRWTPVDVSGLNGRILAVSADLDHSCALTNNGSVKCWGVNTSGKLGNNTTISRSFAGDVLTPATCYALNLSHSGDGADPAPIPNQSQECPPNHYLPGTLIALVSAPAADRCVQSWVGTSIAQSHDLANLVTMLAADHTASVTYGTCRTLTTAHIGDGANPVAIPSQSTGCTLGKYAASEVMTLVAVPDDGQRVQSWAGATETPGDGNLVNTLTMTDTDAMVSVAYEPCVTLMASMQGEGERLQATPVATFGCDPSSYIVGQTVTLLAAPATGWRVVGWIGTANNNSTALTNSVVMGANKATVGVIYQKGELPLFLPSVTR